MEYPSITPQPLQLVGEKSHNEPTIVEKSAMFTLKAGEFLLSPKYSLFINDNRNVIYFG